MNYIKIYSQLIEKAKNRIIDGYVEIHHIIPKCMGGSNSSENLVKLTGREHFIAHLLLAKIHGGRLYHALWIMSVTGTYNSIHYEYARKKHAIILSESQKGKIGKSGKDNGMYGKTHTKESIELIKIANNIIVICPFCKKEGTNSIMKRWHFNKCKLSPHYIPPPKMKRTVYKEDTRIKQRNTVIEKYANGYISPNLGKPQKKGVFCPYCGMEGGAGQMTRWHFDNCKNKIISIDSTLDV